MVTIRWKVFAPNEGASLCVKCTWGHVRTGFRAGEVETFCRLLEPNTRVPFPVRECTGFANCCAPSPAPGARAIGFVPLSVISVSEKKEGETELAVASGGSENPEK
jgi:hypothetical protein